MGESFATFLLLALVIGLAAPFVPFAVRLARRSVHGWLDAALIAALTGVLLVLTFAPVSVVGMAITYPFIMAVVSPLLTLAGSHVGQGAIAFLFVWVGLWAIAVFCVACAVTGTFNAWLNSRRG